MRKHATKIILTLAMASAFVVGMSVMNDDSAKAESAVSGGTISTEATATPVVTAAPMPTATVDVTQIKLNKTKTVLMAKKSVALAITGTTSTVTWTSSNTKAATVSENGVVKGVAKGTAVITASVDGVSFPCTVTVVSKMTKKDFGKFNGENFVSFCQRKGYNNGYAWMGQWKGGSKKKSTYRGIKIGASKTKVTNAYGAFSLKKCTSKDPFTKMKGLKKNKVKKYTDMTYGKYRIRMYFNSKNKVVALIYSCNLSKIKKSALRKYI